MRSHTFVLQFWPNRLPTELLDFHHMALPNASERRLISPHERSYPYRNATRKDYAPILMKAMGRLSSLSTRCCSRGLLCVVRASLPMLCTPARALLPLSFFTTGSPSVCA